MFSRRSLLILLSTASMLLSALACNLPGLSSQVGITETANANVTTAAIASQTSVAQLAALSLTQTALVPTATATATDVPTGIPATAATLAATSSVVNNAVGTPSQTSIANGSLKVGVEAIVSVTGALNVRKSPGKVSQLAFTLSSDTRVKIIEGPQATDNVLWWKIQVIAASTSVNQTGWCVESLDGKAQTLQVAK